MKYSGEFVFLLATLLPAISSAQVSFTATAYPSNAGASSIVSGDFNNDGIIDLVSGGASLSFYKGLGSGKYAAPVTQSYSVDQLAAADFNRDGRLDLVGVGPLTILLGNGNGTFKQGSVISTIGNPTYVTLADFNGDHIPDMAVSIDLETGAGATQLFLGRGDGKFTESSQLPFGGKQIVAGDFNADGHQDIAVLNVPPDDELVMFLGNGDGTFQAPLEGGFGHPEFLAVGDFYNNRVQSLVVMSTLPTDISDFDFRVFRNFVFTARYLDGALDQSDPQMVSLSQSAALAMVAGELNGGDLKDDIVLTGIRTISNVFQNIYLLGNGDGTFQSPVVLPTHGFEGLPFVRDLNRDSRRDIVASWAKGDSSGPYVLLNTNSTTNCNPPKANALGVHICAPYNGQTLGTSFTFKAAGNAFDGIAKRMELWIDGKKFGQRLEDQFKKTITLPAGKHVASFVVVDSFDHHSGKSVTFYVQ
ncbi:MAG: VCBS repeat-containing protein [Terriglobales bacterium]